MDCLQMPELSSSEGQCLVASSWRGGGLATFVDALTS